MGMRLFLALPAKKIMPEPQKERLLARSRGFCWEAGAKPGKMR